MSGRLDFIFEFGDRVWERVKARSPRFQAADQTDDQTHTHHALVTVLLFGSAGILFGLAVPVSIALGLRVGIIVGWVFYVLRELAARIGNWRWKTWDGVGDILEPLWVTAPVVLDSVTLLWILSAVFAAYYFLFRPVAPENG